VCRKVYFNTIFFLTKNIYVKTASLFPYNSKLNPKIDVVKLSCENMCEMGLNASGQVKLACSFIKVCLISLQIFLGHDLVFNCLHVLFILEFAYIACTVR
jgi:hypothetical protein